MKPAKNFVQCVMITCLTAFLGTACGDDDDAPAVSGTGGAGGTDGELPRVGLVMKSLEAEFFQAMDEAAKEHAEERGDLELISVGTQTQTELDQQIDLVDELVEEEGVDALVVVPIDSVELVAPVARAIEAGVEVVNIDIKLDDDTLAENDIEVPFVGPNNEAAAEMVGNVLAEQLEAGDEVVTIDGVQGAANAEARRAGFENAIAAHDLDLVGSGIGNWETATAAEVFTDLLADNPDLKGVMSGNDAMALGVLEVLDEQGIEAGTDVLVVGFDNDESIRPMIRAGRSWPRSMLLAVGWRPTGSTSP